jgi:hypothetical protein
MKCKKMPLIALGVISVVCTALGVTTKSFGGIVYCGTVQDAEANSAVCPALQNRCYAASPTGNRWCTSDPNGICGTRANVFVCL